MLEHLHKVARPGWYIGGETNAVLKNENEVRLKIALAFPEVYEIGMSHLGLKILYGMINDRPEFWAERVMAPWVDKEEDLRKRNSPLCSLESNRPLAEFDMIGFSLQYELTYTNILTMLDLAGLPLLAKDRGEDAPLIVGGGPCAFSPEPLADFFDFFYLGDAEAGFMEVLDRVAAWRAEGGSKRELLHDLAGHTGVYVPSFFKPIYNDQGRLIEVEPLKAGYERVNRALIPDLDSAYFPTRPVVPLVKAVHDRLTLEIARGCTQGCRFCQAGYLYRPVRERQPKHILDLAAGSLAATGWGEASFLSLSAGDYTCLSHLMTAFMDTHAQDNIALSLPSLRVKTLTSDLMEQIKRVRKTGFTLAPEAGTARLRAVINKDLSDDDLLTAAHEAFRLGWHLIKLYFMIGLPTETAEDLAAIIDLVKRVKTGSRSKVNVSFATFVPKAHTPFQWEAMLDFTEVQERTRWLNSRLRGARVKPKWNRPASSLLEGILSRGDRRLGPALMKAQKSGARFEGWSEMLRLEIWNKALAEARLDPAEFLRARDRDEVLPWTHLSTGVELDFLASESDKARREQNTPDCRSGACGNCGVCDFDRIEPRLSGLEENSPPVKKSLPAMGLTHPVRINYTKEGSARFLSHLETMEAFMKAMRRSGLKTRMSQGYHPLPRLAFATPLPVGLASMDEYLEVELFEPPPEEEIRDLLTDTLPRGFTIKRVFRVSPGQSKLRAVGARFVVEASEDMFEAEIVERAFERDRILVTKKGKKGPRTVDLKPLVNDFNVLTKNRIEFTLYFGSGLSVRADEAVRTIFEISDEEFDKIKILKISSLLKDNQ
ncbi:MAG: TIGR03960 family B12-binding radical SAM protein [Deltaproteobacteria bacterium]|nr:TIGR03960 family B12-binding radical SAM protein [Deltaproteobacteria bacterium]